VIPARSVGHRQSGILAKPVLCYISHMVKIPALVLIAAFCAVGQTLTWDFEDAALGGWTQTGEAFAGQPFCKPAGHAEMPSDRFADSHLRGDYWQGLEYPLGQHGNCVVTTVLKTAGAGPSSLTSPEFTLPAAAPFLSFRIGGTGSAAHQRLELQVRRGDAWETAYSATGGGGEQLRQEVFPVPANQQGLPARIRIFDDSPQGHITVDYIRFTHEQPPAVQVPIWGYADYHTHPMTHLAFGANDKRHPIWGNPGGNFDDYANDPHRIAIDIPPCFGGHGGGYLSEAFLNTIQLFSDSVGSVIKAFLLPHGHSGPPQYKDFPGWVMGAHEQMHVTMIHRNYEGGLRLMVALVTDDWGAAFLTGVTRHGKVPLVKEQDTIIAQMQGLRDLAAKNSSWMELAFTPADARRIIRQNKLAVVPGVELDQLGSYFPGDPVHEVGFLWDLGVRAVTPIHAVNNALGSPAILGSPYNWLNDFIENHSEQSRPLDLPKSKFFEIEPDKCADNREPAGECVLYRLSPLQLRLAILRPIFTLFARAPGLVPVREGSFDTGNYGQKNRNGLKQAGFDYIRALMQRGMIVDTAHMSDKSVNDVYSVLAERPGYPAVISHAHFRREGLQDPQETAEYLASEYDISDSNLDRVRAVGGVIGPFMHQPRIDPGSIDPDPANPISRVGNDCGDSSKGFAFAFDYAERRVPGGVGMATDMTFIPLVSPRFGDHPCEGFRALQHPQAERAAQVRRGAVRIQPDPVRYVGVPPIANTKQRDPLIPFRIDGHLSDFNKEGLAHFGLVPDMLQDLKNVGFPQRDFQALFASAEAYLEMWERVEKAALPPQP
jgi:microsomal dipeptidase-like Zn-dependent dipeptidase